MTQTFDSWTDYDEWLIKSYKEYEIIKVDEGEDHKITIEYMTKEEYKKIYGNS